LFPAEKPGLRPGRIREMDRERVQRDHLRVAFQYLVERHTSREVARANGISEATVRVWARKALSYDTQEAEGLRRLVADRANSPLIPEN
jgi:transposase-like protein